MVAAWPLLFAFWWLPSIALAFSSSSSSSSSTTTAPWQELEDRLGSSTRSAPHGPISIDSVFDPSPPTFSTQRPTLFRERHGWCPYSERVWLTLELLNVEHDTVRIDNTGAPRPSYYSGQTPQMRWEDGKQQGESMDLVQQLDKRYNDGGLYNRHPDVQDCIDQFRSIFPRARPSSRAAFLFRMNGEPLWKSTFESTLEQTNELLGSNKDGPFFCGQEFSAADIAWAPFMERYRHQLPCLHEGLEPDNFEKYPHMTVWYQAMDCAAAVDGVGSSASSSSSTIPATCLAAYPCRVQGDASSWRKVLSMAGFGDAGIPPSVQTNMDERRSIELQQARRAIRFDVWRTYRNSGNRATYVAETPHAEAAAVLVNNREALIRDIQKQQSRSASNYATYLSALPSSVDDLDELLRRLAWVLIDTGAAGTLEPDATACPEAVACLATFLDERMCVPRDMGMMPAATIKLVAHTH